MIDRSTWTRGMAGIVSVGVLWALFSPVYSGGSHRTSPHVHCLSNVKQVTLGLLMYESDYEAFPHQDWTEASYPYTKNRDLYHCPDVKEGSGYAMNRYLLRRRLPEDPKIALVFETSDLTMGATSEILRPMNPWRHDRRQVVGCVDGSAIFYTDRQAVDAKMKPLPAKTK